MSEELTQKTPIQCQDSTQSGSISLPDFNLSIPVHVHLTIDPALQAALERIAAALTSSSEPVHSSSEPVHYGLNREQTAELVKKGVVDPAIAGLDPAQKPFEFRGTLVERPDWIRVPGYKDLRYYEDGDKLFVKYAGSSAIETSWQQMAEFSRMPIEERKKARDKLLEERKVSGNTASATTVNCFVFSIKNGKITLPENIQVVPVITEEPPEKRSKKGEKTNWTGIPNHPHLRYRSEDGKLILNYAGSIVETTWQQMEKTAKLDQKYWKQEIEKILGHRHASNRKAAVSLFLKLVGKGDIKVPTPREEFEKNFQQFQAEESMGVNA